jgi:hypothetical protein
MFDVKKEKFKAVESKMKQHRCKHFSSVVQHPTDPTINYAVVAGGCYITTHNDLFLKKKSQSFKDSNLVELFNFKTEKWKVFSAHLCIPRHHASICTLNGFMYVIGGHKLDLPNEFINSIERCHISALQSSFDLINVNYG